MLDSQALPYDQILVEFARTGSDIIRTDPRTHYERIGKDARRPMEPGFIPIDKPPLLTAISYYPNETELSSSEYEDARRHFLRWGETGDVSDYRDAYRGWLGFRDQVPFVRRWEATLFEMLGLRSEETAWLPLVKCPLPAGTAVDKEGMDILRDRDLLWAQLKLIKPEVVLIQGSVVYDAIGRRLDNLKFVRAHPLQKIPQFAKAGMVEQQLQSLVKELRPHIDRLRSERRVAS